MYIWEWMVGKGGGVAAIEESKDKKSEAKVGMYITEM